MKILKVSIDAIWNKQNPPRLVQIWGKDQCDEWCVHGIKLRWSCDICEELGGPDESEG